MDTRDFDITFITDVKELAEHVFASPAKAQSWLHRPKERLDGLAD